MTLEDKKLKKFNIKGLNDEEVKRLIKDGKVNYIPKAPSRTIWQILRANLFTSFNLINIILAIVVIIAGSPKNSIFVGVIVVNTIIGVAQEVRAKDILEKLSVISLAKAKVVRNGHIIEIPAQKIVLGDILYIESGMQILADAEFIDGDGIEIDESMLTGESDSIFKNPKDKLYSGSFVVAGEGFISVTKVGKETYSSSLAEEAKQFKIINSELQTSINKIFKVIIWIVIPLSILLTITQLNIKGTTWQAAVIGTVGGIIGMIPEGLVLLTSATFIVAVIKLSKFDTLVQQLCATEILARVDVLCLDKTGTLTKGKLKLSSIKNIGKEKKETIDNVLALLVNNLPSKNPTQNAILDKYSDFQTSDKCISKIPFSSKRKWGGATFEKLGTWVLGAPEIVLKNNYEIIRDSVDEEAKKGKRVLLLAHIKKDVITEELEGIVEPEAIIVIEDIIRDEAEETLRYFNEHSVDVKILSGDNPVTVAEVARRAGVKNSDKYINAGMLPEDEDEFLRTVKNTAIFGRVTPHQKKRIVIALKKLGHTVAMTGDGVNDVLALKASDCGIAMANGSDATKAVAQLVLMKSDFSALPKVVEEGRKQINNVERVAELFLSKTVYSVILAFICSILMIPFPILPIQLSLVGSCTIGIPGFFLALLPSKGAVKKGFLRRVLTVSIPNGIILAAFTLGMFIMCLYRKIPLGYSRTLALLMFSGISIVILFRVARPLTKFKTILCMLMFGIILLAFLTPIGRFIFSLNRIILKYWVISLLIIGISGPCITKIVDTIRNIVNKNIKLKLAKSKVDNAD
ncbi:cation-translocating P-type ATPase [Clostridium sp. BJN0001]|uniref:cation-translocating P-type ATPase n=1 Tax=Clostridium sp. BJN0001 TaxID=2930219 RepID=UPI001FD5F523|nr:cation-translocating P-type ATPase [Clostridium sp. BJN0001]